MYLAIDLWNKRCGIAVFVEGIIIPKDIVPRTNLIKTLKKYIFQYNVWVIVIWYPYDLYNKDTKQLERTKKFKKKLKTIFPSIKIESIDERFTSFEAENILKQFWETKFSWKKDAISASLILETYLNFIK
jgi:putative transcription antitermination factor YqgF